MITRLRFDLAASRIRFDGDQWTKSKEMLVNMLECGNIFA